MKNYILIVLLPPIVVYFIASLLIDFEFLYYLTFGLMIVGIDLFTMGTYDKVKHNKASVSGTYLILLFSVVFIVFRILSFYTDDSLLTQILLATVVGIPVSLFVYWHFFINHIAGKIINDQKNRNST